MPCPFPNKFFDYILKQIFAHLIFNYSERTIFFLIRSLMKEQYNRPMIIFASVVACNLLNINFISFEGLNCLTFSPLVARVRPRVPSSSVKQLQIIQHSSLSGRLKLPERLLILSQIHPTKFSWVQMICCWTFRIWIWSLLGWIRHSWLKLQPPCPQISVLPIAVISSKLGTDWDRN